MAVSSSSLVCLLGLIFLTTCSAVPQVYFGGDFFGTQGHYSPGFAAFNTSSQQWSDNIPHHMANDDIFDFAPAGKGVFAVGEFNSIRDGNSPSLGVAYYDGTKWCAIRQGLQGGGYGSAVWCDSDTSCYVIGNFGFITNTFSALATTYNFAHYTWSAANNEWEYDTLVGAWNVNASRRAPADAAPGTLVGVSSGGTTFFFVRTLSQNVYRGSSADGGWLLFSGAYGGQVTSFSIDSTPTLFMALNNTLVPKTGDVTTACPLNCAGITPTWTTNYFTPNNTFTSHIAVVLATSGDTRYMIAYYDPDGAGISFVSRWVVVKQVGTSDVVPVGAPFGWRWWMTDINTLFFDQNNNLVVYGSNLWSANLYYPPGNDDNYFSFVRPEDWVQYYAVYSSSTNKWTQAFGGGLAQPGSQGRTVYNHNTQQWFFVTSEPGVFDVPATAAAYYDNSPSLASSPIKPIFTHSLSGPNGDTSPTQYPYESSYTNAFQCVGDCGNGVVYIGGAFGFYGTQTLYAIAQATLSTGTIAQVGGGLGYYTDNMWQNVTANQYTPGWVATLALDETNDLLFAGGWFARSGLSGGNICLSNIAMIQSSTSTTTGQWMDLSGGCDGGVYSIKFYQGLLYVGGDFGRCGGKVVNGIASYSYQSSQPQWASLNNGVDSSVYSMEVFDGRLVVAGGFSHAGGIPASGVAAWNGRYWRPLLASCTPTCTNGLNYYYNVPQLVVAADSLKSIGGYLYARVEDASESIYLGQWHYVDGDFGVWTIKGDDLDFDDNWIGDMGEAILGNGTLIAIGGDSTDNDSLFEEAGGDLATYDVSQENWVPPGIILGSSVYVLHGNPSPGSASTLVSPLSSLLALFW